MELSEYGLYGLGVMGQSLAKNIINHHYALSVYNYDSEVTKKFEKDNSLEKLRGFDELKLFVESLKKPRKVIIIVTAGSATESVIDQLLGFLEKGDSILNFANTFFKDSNKYSETAKLKNCNYFSVGISGGEAGALNGACLMPSGNKEVFKEIKSFLEDISAIAYDGKTCANYTGGGSSGHYVKMVHNGIEYGDIQLICDTYEIMKKGLKISNNDMSDIFEEWNNAKLNSYLIEITYKILKTKDDLSNDYLIDKVKDIARSKGTGKWTSIESMNLGVSIPTIVEALNSRYLSDKKDQRIAASKIYKDNIINKSTLSIKELENALYICKIICYAQGFELLEEASRTYSWNLELDNIASNWRAGCIIRAKLLDNITTALQNGYENIIMNDLFQKEIKDNIGDLRKVVAYAIINGIYIPSLVNSLEYFDGITSERTSANLVQAQRDFFGAHTYERCDRSGNYHTVWEK
jgi:6-phosphogluconate dehydrogenase